MKMVGNVKSIIHMHLLWCRLNLIYKHSITLHINISMKYHIMDITNAYNTVYISLLG